MSRSTDPRIVYPSIAVDRALYFAYKSGEGRPSPGELLEFAMAAYMNVETGQEVTYRNVLETKRQMVKALQDQKNQSQAVLEQLERAKEDEERAKARKLQLQINECLLVLNPKTPLFRRPSQIREVTYNEKICDSVRKRLWDRYQVQPSNVTDDMILDVYFGDDETNI